VPGLLLLACSSAPGSANRDAATETLGEAGAPEAAEAPLDEATDGGGDVAPTDDGGLIPGAPLPAGVAPPVLLLDDGAQLAAFDEKTCSHQDPSPDKTDRWCAFTRPGPAAGLADLWVINATVAATGQVPVCDGSDANCLRLTRTLALTAGAFFEGDTLLYYADPMPVAGGEFLGRIWGWRPGWPVGRSLTSERGILCFGHLHAAVAGCLDDPVGDPARRDKVTVRAGALTAPSADPLPALAGQWALRNDNLAIWQAGFSPDGETFAFSNADQVDGAVTLKTVATRDVAGATPQPSIVDLLRWTVSNDGQKIYFFRGQTDTATLYVADFPTGAAEQLIQSSVNSFALIGDRPGDQAVGLLQEPPAAGRRSFQLLRDRSGGPPGTIFTYSDALEGLRVSTDLRYTLWLDSSFRARLVTNDTLDVCELNPAGERGIFGPTMLNGGGLLFWSQSVPSPPGRRDGYFAAPQTCHDKQRFAGAVDFYLPIGDRGLVFGDERDGIAETVTLKYIAVSADGTGLSSEGPFRIAEAVKSPIVRVGTDPLLLMFRTAKTADHEPGTYIFGPVPF